MVRRISIFLVLAVALPGVALAADFGSPGGWSGRQTVPGANVTIEAGVRVIRPVPFDPAWVVDDETEIPGGVVYRGAAFYRVPGVRAPKSVHKAKPESSEKPQAE